MPRARSVKIQNNPRFNLAKHGKWVEVVHTGQPKIGRIAFFDNQTLLYNVAGMEDRQWWGGQYLPSQLRLLDYPSEPWYGKETEKKGRSDLTAESPSINIDLSRQIDDTPTVGGTGMARRRAVVEEVEDDFDEDFDEDLDDLDDMVEEEDEAPRRRSKAAKKGSPTSKKDSAPKGIGARQIAERLGIDGKTFRAWLRRQVAAGEIELNGRAEKERYDFGPDWSSPMVQSIIKAWNEASHDRGEGLRKAQAANKAKREAAAAAKAPASKKASASKPGAKKAAAKKSR